MKEIKPTISKFKHKAYVNNAPQFKLMPKNELELFIATLESEIRNHYKDEEKTANKYPP